MIAGSILTTRRTCGWLVPQHMYAITLPPPLRHPIHTRGSLNSPALLMLCCVVFCAFDTALATLGEIPVLGSQRSFCFHHPVAFRVALADWCSQAWLSVRKAKEAAEEAGVAPPPATGVWKFNKNTQGWLLRHVFSDDLVCMCHTCRNR